MSAVKAQRKSQHGTYSQIPPKHQKKPVISVVRNPFDRVVSNYEFRWWVNNPPCDITELKNKFPHFPDLTFEEYFKMSSFHSVNDILFGKKVKANIGPITLHFIKFYFKNPDKVIHELTDNYIDNKDFLDDMAKIEFLHTENLNKELYDLLIKFGFKHKRIKFILESKRDNISTQRKGRHYSEYLSEEIIDEIGYKERLIFMLFPEYNIPDDQPKLAKRLQNSRRPRLSTLLDPML